jgi:hypothetical protein
MSEIPILTMAATTHPHAPSAASEQAPAKSQIPFDAESRQSLCCSCSQQPSHVQVLCYSNGAQVRTIGSEGSGNGQFSNPYGGIAIDSDGRFVVVDNHNHRVQVLV